MKLKKKKVLVTGGAGFIGSHVVDLAVKKEAVVTVVDNLSSGNLDNLKEVKKDIKFYAIDIRDADKIKSVLKKQEIVFHLAANADVPRSIDDPDYDFSNNVIGGYNVIRGCLNGHIERVIFASSAAVYGEPSHVPIDEAHLLNPQSPYGVSKVFVEKLGFAYQKSFGLPFCALRIFNNFGERQRRFVMYDLLNKLYANPAKLEVLGTGEHMRDYCYVTDGARCFITAAESEKSVGEVFNLAGGNPIKIKDLVSLLIGVTGCTHVKVTYTGKSWPGDIVQLIGDTRKAKRVLGFEPTVSLSEGIHTFHDWFRNTYIKEKSDNV